MTVQEKLKKLRREKHFSDKDVAEILGMKHNSYSRLEHGVGKIGSFLINKLALLYDKDPEYFVDDPEVESESEITEEIISEPEITEKIEPEPVISEEIMPEPDSEIIDEIEPEPVISEEIEPEIEPESEPVIEQEPEQKALDDEPKQLVPEIKKADVGTIEFQYSGKAVSLSDIIDRAKEICGKTDNLNIYVKPEENRVYYVSGDSVGSFEI